MRSGPAVELGWGLGATRAPGGALALALALAWRAGALGFAVARGRCEQLTWLGMTRGTMLVLTGGSLSSRR